MVRFRSALAALACSGITFISTTAPVRADVVGLVRGTLRAPITGRSHTSPSR